MEKRPPIKSEIKRAVRQRCGFGCIICGCPIYEYDHIIEWSKTRHHREDELTLLCSKHHTEKTNKILPTEEVIKANRSPYNISAELSAPQKLYYSGRKFKLKIGDSVSSFTGLADGQVFSPFAIDGKPVISFTNDGGNILLNVEIRNDRKKTVLKVENSELVYTTDLWDIDWVGQTLTIRDGLREVILEMTLDPPDTISINRGTLHFNGVEINIGKDYIYCLNNRGFLTDCSVHGMGYGFAIGNPIPEGNCGIVISEVPRPVNNHNEALSYMRKKLKEIRAQKTERRLKSEGPMTKSLVGALLLGGSPAVYYAKGLL